MGCKLTAGEKATWHMLSRVASCLHPSILMDLTYALTAGLRLGGAGSCFTMGETMAGWGIPEVGRPGWAGATMCGENRLETRLHSKEKQVRTERGKGCEPPRWWSPAELGGQFWGDTQGSYPLP